MQLRNHIYLYLQEHEQGHDSNIPLTTSSTHLTHPDQATKCLIAINRQTRKQKEESEMDLLHHLTITFDETPKSEMEMFNY